MGKPLASNGGLATTERLAPHQVAKNVRLQLISRQPWREGDQAQYLGNTAGFPEWR